MMSFCLFCTVLFFCMEEVFSFAVRNKVTSIYVHCVQYTVQMCVDIGCDLDPCLKRTTSFVPNRFGVHPLAVQSRCERLYASTVLEYHRR